MSEQPLWQSPTIRLFDADAGSQTAPHRHGLSPRMSLVEFFDGFIVPCWLFERGSQAATVESYRQSLAHWAQFTGDPPLADIDDHYTARFVGGLRQLPGLKTEFMSDHTIRKHCRQVQTCIDLAGPKNPKQRKAQGLIPETAWINKPSVERSKAKDVFTMQEIEALLAACDGAARPEPTYTGVKPRDWWHSLITVAYNTGERRGALLAVEYGNLEGTTLTFPAGIRKGKKKENEVPLNEWALAAIEHIRTDRRLIFPWPGWPKNKRWFAENWVQLRDRAKVRAIGLHGLRKAGATEAAQINLMGAQLMMGHGDMKTTKEFYIDHKVLKETLAVLPQPKQRRRLDDPTQRRLFD